MVQGAQKFNVPTIQFNTTLLLNSLNFLRHLGGTMKRTFASIICLILLSASAAIADERQNTGPSDEEIAQILIQQSINTYSGRCPCPYNRASNGSRCGKRSAYSKPGGASPLCYPSDVSQAQIERYRKRLNNK